MTSPTSNTGSSATHLFRTSESTGTLTSSALSSLSSPVTSPRGRGSTDQQSSFSLSLSHLSSAPPPPGSQLLTTKKCEAYVSYLQNHAFFQGLDKEKVTQVAKLLTVKKIKNNQDFVEQGTYCPYFYIVYDGYVTISIRQGTRGTRMPLTTLDHGKMIGDMSLFNNEKPSAFANAIGTVYLLEFKKSELADLLLRQPSIFKGVLKQLAERVETCNATHPGLSSSRTNSQSKLSTATSAVSRVSSDSLTKAVQSSLTQSPIASSSSSDSTVTSPLSPTPPEPPQDSKELEDVIYRAAFEMIDDTSKGNIVCLRQKFHEFFLRQPKSITFLSLIKLLYASVYLPGGLPYRKHLLDCYYELLPAGYTGDHPEIFEKAQVLKTVLSFNREKEEPVSQQLASVWRSFELIKGCSLFSNLSLQEKIWIACLSQRMPCDKGTVLYKQGDNADAMYIIGDGTMRVDTAAGIFLSNLGAKEFFGWNALFSNGKRSASLTAVTDTSLWKIPGDKFNTCVEEHPKILVGLFNEMVNRIRQHNALMAAQNSQTKEELSGAQTDRSTGSTSSEKDAAIPSSASATHVSDKDNFKLPALTDLIGENGVKANKWKYLLYECVEGFRHDPEFLDLMPRIWRVYEKEYKWKPHDSDPWSMSTMDIGQVLKTIFIHDLPTIDRIEINNELFYKSKSPPADKLEECTFFKNLFKALYKARLAPDRDDKQIETDVANFLKIASLKKDQTIDPQSTETTQSEYLARNPVPCLDVLKACTLNAWGFADYPMRTKWLSKLFSDMGLYKTVKLPGTECHIFIDRPGAFRVVQKKEFAICLKEGIDGKKVPAGGKIIAEEIARLQLEWELEYSGKDWRGTLRIAREPGIMPGNNLKEYGKLLSILG